jgi:predicted transcriptional regulator
MKAEVTEIVSAYVKQNTVSTDQLLTLIKAVSAALSALGQVRPPVASGPLRPAVPIRRSVSADTIICLECGYKGTMLKRHLMGAHNETPDQYRARWRLPIDYPMTATNYAKQRSELAKEFGFGKRGRKPERVKLVTA